MEQPPELAEGRWSPDRLWWWDGTKWVAAQHAPMPPPPASPPPYYSGASSNPVAPAPGLRPFLIVVLVFNCALTGSIAAGGLLAVASGANDASSLVFWLVFVVLFAVSAVALIGVIVRARWARWAAIAAGVAVSLTCLGLIVGIPTIVAAARAPLARTPART